MLAWALWALAILGLLVTAWLDHLLRQAGRPDWPRKRLASSPCWWS